jgi:hypothetical protein
VDKIFNYKKTPVQTQYYGAGKIPVPRNKRAQQQNPATKYQQSEYNLTIKQTHTHKHGGNQRVK